MELDAGKSRQPSSDCQLCPRLAAFRAEQRTKFPDWFNSPVQAFGDRNGRAAPGDQYAVGFRFQRPLTRAWIFRTDGMIATRDELDDIAGIRVELRRKF